MNYLDFLVLVIRDMLRDIVGDNNADAFLEEIGEIKDALLRLGWKEIRPWKEFFAVFKLPQWNFKHLEQRVVTNMLHYRSNYFFISVIVIMLRIIFNPLVFLMIISCSSVSIYFSFVHKAPVKIGDFTFDGRSKLLASLGVSIVVLLLTGALELMLWSVVYILCICFMHMIFRPRSVSSKANRIYDEMKLSGLSWFSGFDLTSRGSYREDKTDPENPLTEKVSSSGYGGDNLGDSVRKRTNNAYPH